MIENARLRLRLGAVLLASLLAVAALEARRRSMPPEPSLSPIGLQLVEPVKLVAPVGDLLAPPEELVWEPVAGAAHYRVALAEVDRSELWSQTVTDTRASIPAPVRLRIVKRKTLLWKVAAFDASGAALRESEHARFRVEPVWSGVD